MNNRLTGCRAAGYPLYAGRKPLPTSHFPPIYITCEKEIADPLSLFVGTKIIKKSVTSLILWKFFLLKNIYSPCINLLNSSRVAVFSLSFTTFLRASVSLRSMLRSTKESTYSFFLSMSVA